MKIYISILFLASFAVIKGQTANQLTRRGNYQYKTGSYDKAEIKYREALEKKPDMPQANYNLGNTLYKRQVYGQAISKYEDAIRKVNDPQKLSNYYYNIGNSYYKQENYESSVEAYKQALRNNQDNDDARHNLMLAKQKLIQQQQQQQQQNKDQEKKDKDKDKKKDKDKSQNQDEQKSDQQKQQTREGEISKEDAERILKAIEQDEKKVIDKLEKNKENIKKDKVDKNW